MSNQLLTATEFAKICQVTPRTIRWYQHQGLLKPTKIDQWNKYAYFDPQQALKVFKIKLLQQFSIPLQEIKNLVDNKILSLDDELERLDNFIKEKQKNLQFLKQINELLSPNTRPNLNTEEIGPYKLFCYMAKNGDYHKTNEYLIKLRKYVTELKLKTLNKEITFYLDPNIEYKPKRSDLEMSLIVKRIPNSYLKIVQKDYYFREFPKTKALTFTFQGPYNYLSLVYEKIDKYIKDQKIKLSGSVFELYLKNPLNEKSSYNYVTKICYPV